MHPCTRALPHTKLGPHEAKLRLAGRCRVNVVHNVHVHRVHDDHVAVTRLRRVVDNIAKDGAVLGRRDLGDGDAEEKQKDTKAKESAGIGC